jgi:hypothetical protein
MVDHEVLNESGTLQRTRFSDGTEVTAGVSTGRWSAGMGSGRPAARDVKKDKQARRPQDASR